MNQRRYDIDALRSIAMFLLIFYHLGISFTSVAPYISFVQNKRFNDEIWVLLSVMNSWRIPLVFLISGIALRLSFQRRTKIEMFKERTKIKEIGNSSITWVMGMFLKDSDELVSSCEAVHVYTDQTTMKPTPITEDLKEKLQFN